MSAADVFRAALAEGISLAGNEAQVLRVPVRGDIYRAWFGHDAAQRPVAYFEARGHESPSFSVSKVIAVEPMQVEPEGGGEPVHVIKLTCHASQLAQVFFAFMDEILVRLSASAAPEIVIPAAASEWRSLLQTALSPISEATAAGLYGELKFLENTVRVLGGDALWTWQRSGFDAHDFIGDDARVEVKTSSFQNRAAVTVHGLKQLEVPIATTLTLAVGEVQKSGDDSVDSVIERLLPLVSEREDLLRKLQRVGYVPGMPGASAYTFTLLSWRYWEITSDTSVLNRSSLPQTTADAISNISYSLDLGSLGPAEEAFDHARLHRRSGCAA